MGHSVLLGVRPEPPGCAIKAFFPFCSLSECACQHPPDKQNCVPHRGSLGYGSCHKRLQYGFCNVKDPLQSTLVRTPRAHACGVLPMAGGWTPPTPPRCGTKQLDPNSGAPHCSRRATTDAISPEKTQGFAPENVFKPEFTRDLMLMWLTS